MFAASAREDEELAAFHVIFLELVFFVIWLTFIVDTLNRLVRMRTNAGVLAFRVFETTEGTVYYRCRIRAGRGWV